MKNIALVLLVFISNFSFSQTKLNKALKKQLDSGLRLIEKPDTLSLLMTLQKLIPPLKVFP